MQTENDYDKEVWNGDLGFVEAIDPDAQEIAIAFDGRTVTYDFGELDQVCSPTPPPSTRPRAASTPP